MLDSIIKDNVKTDEEKMLFNACQEQLHEDWNDIPTAPVRPTPPDFTCLDPNVLQKYTDAITKFNNDSEDYNEFMTARKSAIVELQENIASSESELTQMVRSRLEEEKKEKEKADKGKSSKVIVSGSNPQNLIVTSSSATPALVHKSKVPPKDDVVVIEDDEDEEEEEEENEKDVPRLTRIENRILEQNRVLNFLMKHIIVPSEFEDKEFTKEIRNNNGEIMWLSTTGMGGARKRKTDGKGTGRPKRQRK